MDVFADRLPWWAAGPLLGLITIGMLWVVNKPLGASGGWIDLVGFLRAPSKGLRWTVFFVIGIALGGFLAESLTGGFEISTAYGAFDRRFGTTFLTRGLVIFAAATVMGYGVRMAGGCTSGHGICGTALGSRASWVSTAVFVGTAIASAHVIAWIFGVRS